MASQLEGLDCWCRSPIGCHLSGGQPGGSSAVLIHALASAVLIVILLLWDDHRNFWLHTSTGPQLLSSVRAAEASCWHHARPVVQTGSVLCGDNTHRSLWTSGGVQAAENRKRLLESAPRPSERDSGPTMGAYHPPRLTCHICCTRTAAERTAFNCAWHLQLTALDLVAAFTSRAAAPQTPTAVRAVLCTQWLQQ